MTRYVVVSEQMLTGTISDLPESTRLAWLAILFEQETLRGKVKLPVRSLAKRASITTEQAAEALKIFLSPDEFSSSKKHEGRRLIPIDGEEDWYYVTTYEKHAAERAAFFATLRKQRQRAKQKVNSGEETESRDVTVGHGESRDVTKVTGTGTVLEADSSPSGENLKSTSKTLLSKASPSTTPKRVFSAEEPEMQLAVLLLDRIRARNPQHKEPDLHKWAREIDVMHRLDGHGGRSFADIRRLILWCQADEFWQNNILSPAKLRKQFDQLLLKSGPSRPSGHGIASVPMPDIE